MDRIFSISYCSRPETTQGYNSLWPLHRSAISCHIPKTHRHFVSCFCPSGTDAQSSLHGGGCEDCTQQDHGGQSPSTGACTTFADHFDEWFGQRQSHLVPQAKWFLPSLKIIEPWQRFTLIFVQCFWQSQWRSLTLLERQVSSRHSALLHVLKPEGFYVQLVVPDVEIVFAAVSLSMNTIHPPQSTNVEN